MSNIKQDALAELPPLSKDDVREGLKFVRHKHPLYNVAIWKTLPYLKPVKDYIGIPSWVPRSNESKEFNTRSSDQGVGRSMAYIPSDGNEEASKIDEEV